MERHDMVAWTAAVLGLTGDVVTSFYAIESHGLTESNPLVAFLIGLFGLLPGLFVSKAVVLVVGVYLYRGYDEGGRWRIPAIIAFMYFWITVLNACSIVSVL
jgi:hypothetical protein